MKLNDSLYFDIQIMPLENPAWGYKDFLKYSDLLFFKLREYTGSAGIMMECSIRVTDNYIRDLFIQNNIVYVYWGENESKLNWFKLNITEVKPQTSSQGDSNIVTFAGILSTKFYYDRSSKSYTGNSLQVLETLIKESFDQNNILINKSAVTPIEITKHNKSMTWLRNYSSGSNFMQDVWLHMDLGSSACPLIAITKQGDLDIRDINKDMKDAEPVCYFTPTPKAGSGRNEVRYLNKCNPESHKYQTNLFLGYGALLNIKDIETGKEDVRTIQGSPDLASTKLTETTKSAGFKFLTNNYQSSNVHKTYKQAYYRNISRLTQLSSIVAIIHVTGILPNVNVMDIVHLDCTDKVYDGKYIVNTKVTTFSSDMPIMTTFYLCRDNRNHIEDYALNEKKSKWWDKLAKELNRISEKTLTAVRNLRRLVVMARKVVNGDFMRSVHGFAYNFKYSLLTSFSLFGTTLDFTTVDNLFSSLKLAGNSLCNQIINAYIPYPYSYVLRNFAIEDKSLKNMLSQLLYTFSPTNEYVALLEEISGLLSDLTNIASTIQGTNTETQVIAEYNQSGYSNISTNNNIETTKIGVDMTLQDNQEKIDKITTEFIDNTANADIPIPQIDLNESESLLPYEELRDLMADRTVEYLTQQGYLYGITNFKNILLGIDLLDFNTINKINENTGNMLYARYWGTFSILEDITDFNIKNSYKDIYLTVPTTKIINARDSKKVYIALPKLENNLIFYINNKEVEMDILEDMDLGIYTASGYPVLYNVYMSQEAFNSNSVILEIRKHNVN